ncbi:hypothetical protein CHUAL_007515 [Chamberlinius hualienensis]
MAASDEAVCEIEHNFSFTESTLGQLELLGAKFVDNLIIIDSYYDTSDYLLCFNNHWLRHRNGKWELKYNTVESVIENRDSISKYLEETNPININRQLLGLFEAKNRPDLAEQFNGEGNVKFEVVFTNKFASFETIRRVYQFENDIKIHLDQTNFGCRVGEIELELRNHTASTEVDARMKIREFGRKLGIEWTKTAGKLQLYLKKNNPQLYNELMAANILKN